MPIRSGATSGNARSQAKALLASLSPRQREARWNLGPSTSSILAAMVAQPDRIWFDVRDLDLSCDYPATSAVYVRAPRPMQLSIGPSQFSESTSSYDEYEHPAWCECADLMAFVGDELGLDHQVWPDEILPHAPSRRPGGDVENDGQWIRLWWD